MKRRSLFALPAILFAGWFAPKAARKVQAATVVAKSVPTDPAAAELSEALEFAAGKQWPAAIAASRHRDSRPAIVLNRMPELIEARVQQQQSRLGRTLTEDERNSIVVEVVHKAGDAQRLYNYALSGLAEIKAIKDVHIREISAPGLLAMVHESDALLKSIAREYGC